MDIIYFQDPSTGKIRKAKDTLDESGNSKVLPILEEKGYKVGYYGVNESLPSKDKHHRIFIPYDTEQETIDKSGYIPEKEYNLKMKQHEADKTAVPWNDADTHVNHGLMAMGDSMSGGISSVANPAMETLKKAFRKGSLSDVKEDFNDERDMYRQFKDKMKRQTPDSVTAGNIGGVLASLIGGGTAGGAAKLIPSVGKGVTTSVGTSVAEQALSQPVDEHYADKLLDTASTSGLISAAIPLGGAGVAKAYTSTRDAAKNIAKNIDGKAMESLKRRLRKNLSDDEVEEYVTDPAMRERLAKKDVDYKDYQGRAEELADDLNVGKANLKKAVDKDFAHAQNQVKKGYRDYSVDRIKTPPRSPLGSLAGSPPKPDTLELDSFKKSVEDQLGKAASDSIEVSRALNKVRNLDPDSDDFIQDLWDIKTNLGGILRVGGEDKEFRTAQKLKARIEGYIKELGSTPKAKEAYDQSQKVYSEGKEAKKIFDNFMAKDKTSDEVVAGGQRLFNNLNKDADIVANVKKARTRLNDFEEMYKKTYGKDLPDSEEWKKGKEILDQTFDFYEELNKHKRVFKATKEGRSFFEAYAPNVLGETLDDVSRKTPLVGGAWSALADPSTHLKWRDALKKSHQKITSMLPDLKSKMGNKTFNDFVSRIGLTGVGYGAARLETVEDKDYTYYRDRMKRKRADWNHKLKSRNREKPTKDNIDLNWRGPFN